MKTNKIIIALAAAMMLLPVQSCQKMDEDVFETSSSERMEQFIQGTKDALLSHEAWFLDYYAGTGKSYGGYAYVLKFDKTSVEAYSELDAEHSYKSLYRFTRDNGPVLSFDTNNPVLHYFATPSSTAYEAMKGDFEFMVLDYSTEKITLLGKRSGNRYFLTPYDSKLTPSDYMKKVNDLSADFAAPSFEGVIGSAPITGQVDVNNRWITIKYGEGEEDFVTTPFVFTDNGMRFYEPVVVDGCTINYLWYVPNNNLLTNGVFTLKGKLPEDYKPYSAFEGKFDLVYYDTRKFSVTLTPTEDGKGYTMSGLFGGKITVLLTYDKGLGRLRWNAQQVGVDEATGNTVMLAAWALNGGGSLTWNTDAGMTIHWVEENQRFEFEDNGGWSGKVVDSWILWALTPEGNSAGQYSGYGSSQIPYLNYLKKL